MNTLKTILIIASVAAAAYIAWPSGHKNYESTYAVDRFKLSDKKYHFEYQLEKSETSSQGVLTMTGDQAGISEGGVVKLLHYLSESDASTFKRTYGEGMCPAPFFNQHAKQRLLIPFDVTVENQLKNIHFDDYRNSAKWRNFSITGFCIQSAPILEIDGKPVQLPSNMFDDCMTMVVKDIKVSSS